VRGDLSERELSLADALQAHAGKYLLTLCHFRTKRAVDKGWERKVFTEAEIRHRLMFLLFNLALRAHGLRVFDKAAKRHMR